MLLESWTVWFQAHVTRFTAVAQNSSFTNRAFKCFRWCWRNSFRYFSELEHFNFLCIWWKFRQSSNDFYEGFKVCKSIILQGCSNDSSDDSVIDWLGPDRDRNVQTIHVNALPHTLYQTSSWFSYLTIPKNLSKKWMSHRSEATEQHKLCSIKYSYKKDRWIWTSKWHCVLFGRLERRTKVVFDSAKQQVLYMIDFRSCVQIFRILAYLRYLMCFWKRFMSQKYESRADVGGQGQWNSGQLCLVLQCPIHAYPAGTSRH